MTLNRSIYFADPRNHIVGGEITLGARGNIVIVIANTLLEEELRDCLANDRQTNLRFTYAKIEETVPDTTHWIAFHFDMSDVLVFTNELDACRYAWRNSMRVAPYIPGESIHDTIHNTIRRPGD